LLECGRVSTITGQDRTHVPHNHTTFNPARHFEAVAGRKFFLLFLFLLASLLFYPYAESNALGYYAFRVLGSAAIIFCVYAASFRRSLVIIAILLAIPAFAQRVLNLSVDASSLSILNVVLSFSFDVLIVVIILRRVIAAGRPNSETIFAALSIYLLIGFAFASVYGMLALMDTQAFYLDPLTNLHARPDRLDFIYFSFATMTSVGAAGIVPVSGEARCVCVIEAILGVLYLAVLISRLIGAYRHPTA
jgi:Ion channel